MKGEPLSTEPYKGVRDFYPNDWAKLDAVFALERLLLTRHGYEEYQASPLERAELYEAKTSEEIVNEQTYTFEDRGGRRVTLRPEMTPTLARMLARKRGELTLPLRWFSIGNRFRYERPQRGRLREFYQSDIDLIGLPEGEADLEIVALAAKLLRSFGASDSDYRIRLSYRPLLSALCEAAGLSSEGTRSYMRLLDKKAKMPVEEFRAAVSVLSDIDPLSLIENDDEGIRQARETVMAMRDKLHARGYSNVEFDPTLTRGFDYYTGMVFEIFDTNPENPRALFGGGRYDGLVALFGGDPLPAVGFAVGDVTFIDFLETHNLEIEGAGGPTLYIGTPSPTDAPSANSVADELRKEGVRVFVNLTERSLGDQIKDAVRRDIPYFMVVGEVEAESRTYELKELATGTSAKGPLSDLVNRLVC